MINMYEEALNEPTDTSLYYLYSGLLHLLLIMRMSKSSCRVFLCLAILTGSAAVSCHIGCFLELHQAELAVSRKTEISNILLYFSKPAHNKRTDTLQCYKKLHVPGSAFVSQQIIYKLCWSTTPTAQITYLICQSQRWRDLQSGAQEASTQSSA